MQNFQIGEKVYFNGFGFENVPGIIDWEPNNCVQVFLPDEDYYNIIEEAIPGIEPMAGIFLDNPGTSITRWTVNG